MMALRCLRLARAGGPCHGLQPNLVQPFSVQKRFLREKDPDTSNVFGTRWQDDSYKPPHPRHGGWIPYLRVLSSSFALIMGAFAATYHFKKFNSLENYDLPNFFLNHQDELEKRKAIRESGWNPPSYSQRPGLLNFRLHVGQPYFPDDPLIPSDPAPTDPGVSANGELVLPWAMSAPWQKDSVFLDRFFPDPYHITHFRDSFAFDRYISRDMMDQYQVEMDKLQELAAAGHFPTISQEEYDRRLDAWVEKNGQLPVDMLKLTIEGEPVWIDPNFHPKDVFEMLSEGQVPGEEVPSPPPPPPTQSDATPVPEPPVKKPKKKKKKSGKSPSSAPPPPPASPVSQEEGKPSSQTSTTALPDLPKHIKYVIIGAGTAAFSAVRGIKRNEPDARILVIGEEAYLPYMRPPLSKELWFGAPPASQEQSDEKATEPADPNDIRFLQWNGKERSVYYEPSSYYTDVSKLKEDEHVAGVAVVTGHRVVKLDPTKQRITLDNDQSLSYNKCLIATGGQPINLPSLQNASPEVRDRTSVFRSIADFQRLEELTRQGKSVAIVGGGFLGSELACALAKRARSSGGKVTQVFPESGNMAKVLPTYLSEWTTQKVRKEGVEVVTHSAVVGARFNGARVELSTSQGDVIEADNVIVAVGIQPNTDLAPGAHLELDEKRGGFLVNSELEARSNVWVAGDASCFYDASLGRRRVEHHDHAVVSGRLAGENMTGQQKTYIHQSMFWSDLGPEVGYEAIGVCDSSLPTVAVWAKATEQDTPAAAAASAQGDSALRSETEEQAKSELSSKAKKCKAPAQSQELVQDAEKKVDPASYGKGVVFYMREKKVVGILLWNVFNRMPLARQILADAEDHEDLSQLAKSFKLYEE